jgi:nucleotide-binding universal stress UspA family protein
MSCTSLLVHLETGQSNEALLRITGDLAQRLQADVFGCAARRADPAPYGEVYALGDLLQSRQLENVALLQAAQTQFRQALQDHGLALSWHASSDFESVAAWLAQQARSADLLLTGLPPVGRFDAGLQVDVGDLVMQAGRPVLLVPQTVSEFKLDWAMVGFNGTREARRAIHDALPLLRLAKGVHVVEIAAASALPAATARLDLVVAWLARHGVAAHGLPTALDGDQRHQFGGLALAHGADLVVAGAYGHQRLREWVFGGVTQELLVQPPCCLLLSH